MKRLVALAGLTAPLLVVTPSAFAATGVGVITTPTTSTSTGSLSTSAVTGTVTQVTQPLATVAPALTTTAPSTTTTSSSTTTAPSSTSGSQTSALTGALAPLTSASTASSSSSSSTTNTPAPPGTSEAYAAEVAGVVAISHTKATADGNPNDSSATADPLELGGNPVVGGTVSGSKGGESDGTLFGPGDPTSSANPLEPLGLEVMPYDAKVTNSSTGQTSHADASLLTLLLPDSGGPTVYADVLHSESNAAYTYGVNGAPDTSSGDTTSYGAHINLGGTSPSDTCSSNSCLDIYLLYSHTDSSGQGNSYLASVNGNQVVNASQVANQCNIPLNPLIDIVCVYATGGTGATGSTSQTVTKTAGVLTATSPSGLPTINVVEGQTTPAKTGGNIGAGSNGGNGTTLGGGGNGGSGGGNGGSGGGNGGSGGGNGGSGGGNGGTGGGNGGGSTPSVVTSGLQPGAAGSAAASTLPFTGFDAGGVALLGGFLAMVGAALRRSGAIARRRA